MHGVELKRIREGLGRTQRKFAEEIGMTPSYIGLMERGERPIERRTELAALYLQVSDGGTLHPVPMPAATRIVEHGLAPRKRPIKVKKKSAMT